MKIKSILAKPFAGYIYKSIQKNKTTALSDQEHILKQLKGDTMFCGKAGLSILQRLPAQQAELNISRSQKNQWGITLEQHAMQHFVTLQKQGTPDFSMGN